MLRLSTATLATWTALVTLVSGSVSAQGPAVTPAFLWSSKPGFTPSAGHQTSRISHEVKQAQFLFDLVDGLTSKGSSSNEYLSTASPAEAIVMVIGQSTKAGDILQPKNAAEAAPLRQAMTSASSSLALPFLQNMGGDLVSSWQAHLSQLGISSSLVGDCSQTAGASSSPGLSSEAATQGIQAALSKASQVILVCTGEDATLEQEMQLVEAATAAAGSSSAVFGFIVQPSKGSQRSVGRSLLEASAGSGSVLRMPTEDDLASIAASREATAAAAKELAGAQLGTQMAGLVSDSQLTPAGFKPAPGGLKPSSLPQRPGNQGGGDTPFQGLACDDKCQVQVTMIEAAILGFTVISALVSGTWLMHGVGTPTRFETNKESQHSQ